jgi:hypothetical protein
MTTRVRRRAHEAHQHLLLLLGQGCVGVASAGYMGHQRESGDTVRGAEVPGSLLCAPCMRWAQAAGSLAAWANSPAFKPGSVDTSNFAIYGKPSW